MFREKVLLLAVSIFLALNVNSQSVHFTQFWTSPAYINPANAGVFDGNFRLAGIQRTQWFAIGNPYVTFLGGLDAPVYRNNKNKYLIGASGQFLFDRAGDSKYSTYQGIFGVSGTKIFGKRSEHHIGLGISLGFSQRTIDYSALYFDEQFQNGAFNPDHTISETFGVESFFFMDIGFGVLWIWNINDRLNLKVNLSATHLNIPNQSLNSGVIYKINPKTYMSASVPVLLGKKFILEPIVFYSFQKKYQELMLGCLGSYPLNYDLKLNGGLLYRTKDAFVLQFGLGWQQLQVNFAYDLTLSKLQNANQVRGGPEIAVSWIFKKVTKNAKRSICPENY